MQTINIYTDGSSKKFGGGWAFYCEELNLIVCNEKINTTNNEMELTAIERALEYLSKIRICDTKIVIKSDSAWAIGIITQNWNVIYHTEILYNIREMISKLVTYGNEIQFKKVKGHSNILGNELCDKFSQINKI